MSQEGIDALERRIAENDKEIVDRTEENKHLKFTLKLLKRKQSRGKL